MKPLPHGKTSWRTTVGVLFFCVTVPCWADAPFDRWAGVNQAAEQVLTDKEMYLATLRLEDHQLKPLRQGNTTKTAWRVVSPQSGQTVALLKCSSGNTYAPGAMAAYRLGKYLRLPLHPVSVSRTVSIPSLGLRHNVCALKEWMRFWAQYYWKAPQRGNTGENTFLYTKNRQKARLAKALQCAETIDVDQPFIY